MYVENNIIKTIMLFKKLNITSLLIWNDKVQKDILHENESN